MTPMQSRAAAAAELVNLTHRVQLRQMDALIAKATSIRESMAAGKPTTHGLSNLSATVACIVETSAMLTANRNTAKMVAAWAALDAGEWDGSGDPPASR